MVETLVKPQAEAGKYNSGTGNALPIPAPQPTEAMRRFRCKQLDDPEKEGQPHYASYIIPVGFDETGAYIEIRFAPQFVTKRATKQDIPDFCAFDFPEGAKFPETLKDVGGKTIYEFLLAHPICKSGAFYEDEAFYKASLKTVQRALDEKLDKEIQEQQKILEAKAEKLEALKKENQKVDKKGNTVNQE